MEAYSVLKNLVIGISCFLIFCKFIEIKRWNTRHYFSAAVMTTLILIRNTLLTANVYEIYADLVILILINIIIFKPLKLKFSNVFTFLLVSYSGSLLLFLSCHSIASFVFAFIYTLVFGVVVENAPIATIVYLSSSINFIVILIFHLIRFKFKINNFKNFRGISFSIFGMMLNTYSLIRIINSVDDGVSLLNYQTNGLMFIVSFVFIVYGQFTILKRETLQSYSDRALNHKLNEISSKFNDLMQTHDFLSERVHKDNKYLNAFNNAVRILLNESSDIETRLKAQRLMDDITEYRQALQIEKEKHFEDYKYSLSGMVLLDSIFLYMLEQATQKGIELKVAFDELPDRCTDYVTEEQLSTLIADFIENSIVSVENNANLIKKISCNICKNTDTGNYQIVIRDSGNAFDKNVLDNIGKRKTTTRKETGGSGIGLWNVYKIMRLSKASLIINEFVNDSDFTKAIIFRFDGKCEYKYQFEREKVFT